MSNSDRYIDAFYERQIKREENPLDEHIYTVLLVMNKRDLTWNQKAEKITEKTGIYMTIDMLKRYVPLRLIDQEAKPALNTYRGYAVKLIGSGLNSVQVRDRISREFGHSYSASAVQRMCAEIRNGGKKKVKAVKKGSFGANFFTGSLRTTAICRPWSDLSAVSARS